MNTLQTYNTNGKASASPAAHIQTKLAIGRPNDRYEQEADRVADQVVNQSGDTSSQIQKQPISSIQRQEEELQMKAENSAVHASRQVNQQIHQTRGDGSPLPWPVRQQMENGIGADFNSVRVHTGQKAERLSQSLSAQAFTVGNDIFFNKNKFNPGTTSGKHLLAHELTHTVQQGKSKEKSIQRNLVFGEGLEITGYEFVADTDLPLAFLKIAHKKSADGNISNEDLLALHTWAVSNGGTVDDKMKYFMAGLLDPANIVVFNQTKLEAGASFAFPFTSITSDRRAQVDNLNRDIDTSEIDRLSLETQNAYLFGGMQGLVEKMEERDQAIVAQIVAMAGPQYATNIELTLTYAVQNGINVINILNSMINAASDSTPADRCIAAMAYTVSATTGLVNSGHLISGTLKVDALSPSEFVAIFGGLPAAGYSATAGGAHNQKGDTFYYKDDMDITNVFDRSIIIHEMTHAEDDESEDPTGDVQEISVLYLEYKAHIRQGNYILEEMANIPVTELPEAAKKVTAGASSAVIGGIIHEYFNNQARYQPILREILVHDATDPSTVDQTMANIDTEGQGFFETATKNTITRLYGLNLPNANTEIFLDGLSGDSMTDWLNRYKP